MCFLVRMQHGNANFKLWSQETGGNTRALSRKDALSPDSVERLLLCFSEGGKDNGDRKATVPPARHAARNRSFRFFQFREVSAAWPGMRADMCVCVSGRHTQTSARVRLCLRACRKNF